VLLLIPLLAACGCDRGPGSGAGQASSANASAGSSADPGAGASADGSSDTAVAGPSGRIPLPSRVAETIAADGIGAATRGRTVGELRAALPPGTRLGQPDPRYMVDLTALPVIAAADTVYVLLFPAGEVIDDSAPLQYIATTHPGARTAEGVGPGTSLEAAAAVYGPPTLSYNINDESREYATFEGQPTNILFRVATGAEQGMFAGIYETRDEYNTTTRYEPGARLLMVMVDLTR
jgi:hypothetical protein